MQDQNLIARWTAAQDDDLKHYEVFVDNALLGTTATPTWTFKNLRPWQSVRVRVEAVDHQRQRSLPLKATGRAPDSTSPVFNAAAKWSEDETSITWNAKRWS
ncbi:MAG: hypothetical protein GY822_28680 [Deltaproteobacteria bacterium]|nr:hypothetical protein [Deltaproteobacteria bacterium]